VLAALCENSTARAIARIVSEVLRASAMPYLKMTSERNLGTPDFEKLRVEVVHVS
jgi:hypothetical protein